MRAEEWVDDWKGMNDEFIREDTMFRLSIPSVERVEEWMAEEPIILTVNNQPMSYFDERNQLA